VAEPASLRSAWESFYVIVGSSGAALVGLQFVVITLIADMRPSTASLASVSAFGTPTVVHLGGALAISAIMSAPWPSLAGASVTLTIGGLAGIIYNIVVIIRARRQTEYQAVLEDWIWHIILPGAVYVVLVLAALTLSAANHVPLFLVAGAALALLFIGIHNAWDTVIYLVFIRSQEEIEKEEEAAKP